MSTGIIDGQQQLVETHHTALRTFFALDGAAQLRCADRCGTELADHDAGGQVGQAHGMGQLFACGDGGGQGRNHRITGTGDVEDFTGTGWQVQGRMIGAQQGHAMLTTGHQQGAQLQFAHQLSALGHQLRFIGAAADDGLELAEVRGDQAGTAVNRKVLALGVGQDRDPFGPSGLDQALMVLQGAFAVIRQHQYLDPVEQGVDFSPQRQRIGGERFFEIDSQQLLVAAHDPQLDDGRLVRNTLENRAHTCSLQAIGQALGGLVLAGNPDQRCRCAQGGDVQGHVGRTTRTVLDLFDLDHRYRRFRRDP
ncbi:hypothetical protein D3C80_995950 [compost metagenome]